MSSFLQDAVITESVLVGASLSDIQRLCKARSRLLNSTERTVIWPKLAGLPDEVYGEVDGGWRTQPCHRDEDQVMLDVQRTQFLVRSGLQTKDNEKYREELNDLIVRLLREHPTLSYYQGLHDIAALILIVLKDRDEPEVTYKFFEMFSFCHLRDFMMPDLTMSTQMLNMVPECISLVDRQLYDELSLESMKPFFCLSPIITLLTHDIKNFSSLCLIFDQVLACGSIGIVVYIYVALMINQQDKYLEKIRLMEQEDMFSREDLVHNALSKFLMDVSLDDVELAIADSYKILEKWPLEKLKSFKRLRKWSVMKTTSKVYVGDIRKLVQSRAETDFAKLLKKQMMPSPMIVKLLMNEKNHRLIKISLSVGIISIVLSILLNKHHPQRYTALCQTVSSWLVNTNHAGKLHSFLDGLGLP